MPNPSPRMVHRPTYGRRPRPVPRGAAGRHQPAFRSYRRSTTRRWPWPVLATVLCLAGLMLAAVTVVRARASECQAPPARLIDATQLTAEEGYGLSPPPGLVSRAEQLASCSGGSLIMLQAAGQGAQAQPPVPLRVYREPGQLENDPTARANAIRAVIGRAFRRALATPVRGDGRDLIGLLAAISQDRSRGGTEAWLTTFGLPTVAPADTRILMAADPAQAAQSIRHWLPDLRGVRVHLILNPPAGDQPRLNTATDDWRRGFVTALLRDAGASVVTVTESQTAERAAPGAPPAPQVRNLPEQTPRLAKPSAPARPYQVELDSAAFFLPNSAAFATTRRRVLASLASVVTAWKTGGYARVTVVGHCARFGPPSGALALSRTRARIIAALLRTAGVTHITAVGLGYSRPLPPNPYSAANRVVVVTIYPKA